MYTLEQLQHKNIKQLKEIGWQLNVLPEGDRRCRQNWIDALVGINSPLLQLLEVSPAAEEVELSAKVIAPAAKTKKRAQKLIAPAVKTKKRAQKLIEEVQALASFKIGDLVKSLTKRRGIKNKSLTGTVVLIHPSGGVRVAFFGGGTLDYSPSQLKDLIVQEPPITKVVNILKFKSPEILSGIAWHFFNQSPEWLKEALCSRIWDESEDIRFVEMIIRSFCGNRLLGCNFDNIFEIFQRVLAVQEEIQARELARQEEIQARELARNEKRQARKLEVQRQEPIAQAVENTPGVEVDPAQEPIDIQRIEAIELQAQDSIEQAVENSLDVEFFGFERATQFNRKNFSGFERVTQFNRKNFSGSERVTQSNRKNFSGFERATESNRKNFSGFERVQEPIAPFSAKKLPGSRSKASTAHQLLELFQSRAHIIENSPGVKTEATVSGSAIGPAAKNPILTGVTFSDRFLARYAPPQVQIIHFQSDADGQLSLLNFEIESVDEPPDPDDFESLDAFREALARWDSEHNEVSPQHNEVSPEHNEPLQVSLDSFCLWAHCPHTWYEPISWHPSEVMELLRVGDSSDTSNFFIPTFGSLGNPTNRRNSDEFSTAGVGVRLPKPSLPSFPPMTACPPQLKRIPNAAQTQFKRIPNASQTHTCCIVAASSTQPARSPPGGDAGF